MQKAVIEKLEGFFSNYRSLKYEKGENIIRADDPIIWINLLVKGYVRQYLISSSGHELTIQIFKPKAFFPILLAFGTLPNRYYFGAVTDVELRRSPVKEMLNFIRDEPDILFDFVNHLSHSYYDLVGRFEHLIFEQSYFRVTSLFIYLARRLGEKKGTKVVIKLPLIHEDIANWAGINRETASRQVEKLVELDLIRQKGHVFTVTDLKKLELEIG